MFEKLRKHSVKIFVFTINILLAAIAVFIIREKDQARLLENASKENLPSENTNRYLLPSFENSVSAESAGSNSSPENIPDQPSSSDNSAIIPPAPSPVTATEPKAVAPPAPTVAAPTPVPAAKPSNAKTKTS
jgi:hypothetical protein